MDMKIVLSIQKMDKDFEHMVNMLSKFAEIEVVGLDGYSLENADIFIGKKLSAEVLEKADKLKAVFAYKTGVDDFPIKLIKEKGITLVNSHADSNYIAEYAFGLALTLANRTIEFDKKMRRGEWYDAQDPYWKSIFEMKIGLLGYGHIGKNIHEILQRNCIEAYTIDRGHEYKDIKLVKTFDELCEKVSLIIISLPKLESTDKLFDAKAFELLKGKYIVNVGRSNCIDEKALYDALKSNQLAGAAIDTWERKPKNTDELVQPSIYPFTELENIILSPHQAMRVDIGHTRYVNDITSKVIDYINGDELRDVVDLTKGY